MHRRTLLGRLVAVTAPLCLAGCVNESSDGNGPTTAAGASDESKPATGTTAPKPTETVSKATRTSTEVTMGTDDEFAACERRNQQLPDVTVENRADTQHTLRVTVLRGGPGNGKSRVFERVYEVAAGGRVETPLVVTAPGATSGESVKLRAIATLENGRSESYDASIVAIQPLLYGIHVVVDSESTLFVSDWHVDPSEDFDQAMCFDEQTTRFGDGQLPRNATPTTRSSE